MFITITLESGTGQEALLETIDRLSLERRLLQLQCARHLWNEHQVVQHLHAIEAELDALWGEVRRVRAVRRIHLEKALGIDPAWAPYEPEQLVENGDRNSGGSCTLQPLMTARYPFAQSAESVFTDDGPATV